MFRFPYGQVFGKQIFSLFLIGLLLPVIFASLSVTSVSGAMAQSIRSADEVMQLHVSRDDNNALQLQWTIAPKVYMYREKIQVEKPDGTLLPVDVSEGVIKDDMNFGSTEVLHNRAFAQIADSALPKDGHVLVRWQGCEEDSICYPPVTKSLDLQTLALSKVALGFGGQGLADSKTSVDLNLSAPKLDLDAQDQISAPPAGVVNEDDAGAWLTSNFAIMLSAFFGFGLLLSLTPCVFPMVPILSGMLARSGDKLTAGRGFVLSTAYVVAMAGAYAVLGFAASWSGYNLQAALQTPYALGFMALVFILLAFSMFGYYELQLPARWTAYFSRSTSGRAGNGSAMTGALLLGFGSALIVGPCVTPPLAAALLYVAQTGDAVRGASALFVLGLGMGVPLIIFGTFGAKLLPKSGPWLNKINQIFGTVFLGLALFMIMRLLSDENAMLLLAVAVLACGVFLGGFDRLGAKSTPLMRIEKTTGIVALLYGALLMIGFAGGSTDPWKPLAFLQSNATQTVQTAAVHSIKIVKSSTDYDLTLKEALVTGKPVLVDFTADWCTTCKTNEKVLQKPEFAARLGNLITIKADISDYNDHSRELMKRFDVVGPPTLMFLEARTGRELNQSRIIGDLTSQKLNDRLQALGI